MKIRVKLIREYELKYDREELAEEHGIDSIEEITDMEELDTIDDAAGTITTWLEPGSIEVVEKENYKCDECGLVMSLYDDEIGPCPGCGREAYKATEDSNQYTIEF